MQPYLPTVTVGLLLILAARPATPQTAPCTDAEMCLDALKQPYDEAVPAFGECMKPIDRTACALDIHTAATFRNMSVAVVTAVCTGGGLPDPSGGGPVDAQCIHKVDMSCDVAQAQISPVDCKVLRTCLAEKYVKDCNATDFVVTATLAGTMTTVKCKDSPTVTDHSVATKTHQSKPTTKPKPGSTTTSALAPSVQPIIHLIAATPILSLTTIHLVAFGLLG